jgi:hypothetical protein
MDSKELTQKASEQKNRITKNLNERYKYARSLGFTSYESTVLQSKQISDIDDIARERGYIE